MKLTDHQQKMLDGAFGKGKAMAMQIQIGVGKCFDAERLVRAVAERGRLIEINNNSFVARPGCDVNCRKIARLCMQYDVRVCVDSDAHFCANVGEVPKALEMLDSIDFPPELIVNSTFERFEAYIAEREARMKTASVL